MTDLVGIEAAKKKVVGWLVNRTSGREVVSLTGMGGLGKLPRQNNSMMMHSNVHAWIAVSQSYEIVELLQDIVQQLFSSDRKLVPKGMESMNSSQLKSIIKELLQNRRYLILLLTTCNSDLALTSRIEPAGKVYNLEPLPPGELMSSM